MISEKLTNLTKKREDCYFEIETLASFVESIKSEQQSTQRVESVLSEIDNTKKQIEELDAKIYEILKQN